MINFYNSTWGAKLCYLTSLRHLIRSRAVKNRIFFPKANFPSCVSNSYLIRLRRLIRSRAGTNRIDFCLHACATCSELPSKMWVPWSTPWWGIRWSIIFCWAPMRCLTHLKFECIFYFFKEFDEISMRFCNSIAGTDSMAMKQSFQLNIVSSMRFP